MKVLEKYYNIIVELN